MKKISLITLSLIATLSIFTSAFAQTASVVGNLESVDCFTPGLYKFQSVQVSVGPENGEYTAGDTIKFLGDVVNDNTYPVVGGNVFVRISKDNPDYITDGHNTVSEMIALTDISVDASASLPVSFSWVVPKDLGAGDYRVDYFFSVGKKFNLGGLPFTNEIIVGFSNFKVINTKNTEFVLDRTATKINGEKYAHIGNWPFIPKDSKIEITQPIKNLTNKEIKVNVSYDLYFWDSLNETDKIESKTETVIVSASSSKVLSYVIPKSLQSIYYLKIKATVGDASSIVNIRTKSDVSKARINYPAITTFPLLKGESADLFSCFHSVYGVATNSKMVLTLTDKNGVNVAKGEYSGNISSMTAASMKVLADKDYRFLNLKAELYNEQGKLVDSYQTKYDCSTLKSDKCEEIIVKVLNKNIILILLFFTLIAVTGLLFTLRIKKNIILKNIFLVVFIFLLVFVVAAFVWVFMLGVDKIEAETITNGGKTKTETRSSGYTIKGGVGSCRLLTYGNINITYTATLIGNTNLLPNETVRFSTENPCTFNTNDGAWDTPYCGSASSFGDSASHHDGSLTLTSGGTGKSLTSSNPAVLSCTGFTCRAVGPGTANVTVNFNTTNVYIQSIYWNADGGDRAWPNSNGRMCDSTNWNISGYHPSWTFTVVDPTPTPGVCGTVHNNCLAGTPVRPNEESGPVNYRYTWYCSGSFGGPESEMCIEPKPVTNGQCAPTHYGCVTGTSTNPSGELTGPPFWGWRWTCQGQNGGANPNCTETIPPINGVCGTAKDTCVSGDLANTSETATGYKWDCIGSYGGSSEYNCSRVYPGILNCRVFMTNPPSSPVNIGTLTSWIATSSTEVLTDRQTVWTISDTNSTRTSTTTTNTISNNYTTFTTTGLKTVSAMIASTTASGTHIYLNCLANTAVFRRITPGGPLVPVRETPGIPPGYTIIQSDDSIYISGPNAFGTTTMVQTGGNTREI